MTAASRAYALPQVIVTPVGDEQIVFDWSRDACETWDIPDSPARAFRDASGLIRVIASHYANRALIGPDLNSLRRDCNILFAGRQQDAPEKFDDRAWLSGFLTEDGTTVYALVHNEYQGNHRPTICPSQIYMRCWRNAITFATSYDGGRTFIQLEPPAHLVATPPYVYEGDYGRNVGYFNPTNIIRKDGFYFALFSATEYKRQGWGVCVMRTDRVADPSSWRAWDGTAFTVRFTNPYDSEHTIRSADVCAPVGMGKLLTPLGGVVRHEPSGAFILIMAGTRRNQSGIYVSASDNLIEWSEPTLAWALPTTGSQDECPKIKYDYPALIDETSSDRTFNTVGSSAHLYMTAHNFKDCRPSPDRDLLRRAVQIEVLHAQP